MQDLRVQRKTDSIRRKKIYNELKEIRMNMGEKEKLKPHYDRLAEEYGYEDWKGVAQLYNQERLKDKNPLPLRKVKKEGSRKNQFDKPKND